MGPIEDAIERGGDSRVQFVELLVWNNWRLPAFVSRSILHFHSGEDERTLPVILSPGDGETEASIYYFKSLFFFFFFSICLSGS